jgi:hypothetical protein
VAAVRDERYANNTATAAVGVVRLRIHAPVAALIDANPVTAAPCVAYVSACAAVFRIATEISAVSVATSHASALAIVFTGTVTIDARPTSDAGVSARATIGGIVLQVDAASTAAAFVLFAFNAAVTAVLGIAGYIYTSAIARHLVGRRAPTGSVETRFCLITSVPAFPAVLFVYA